MTGAFAQPIITAARKARNRLFNLVDPPVVVLIYHRVTTLPSDPQLLTVTPDNFRAHLQYLKRNFPVVRFEADWSQVRKPAVAVTFDDGYADNALEALPILEEVGVPATFFVSTGTTGTRREFWWDELERVILGEKKYPATFTLDDRRFGRSWPTEDLPQREAMYRDLHPLMMRIDAAQREAWLEQFRGWAKLDGTGREANRPLTQDELRRLAQSPWATIGAHTVTHTPLSTLAEDEQRYEIITSKRQLETLLGREITVFSYPFGRKSDYNGTSVRICREAGFVKVAANFPGQAHRWTDHFQLPRQLVRNWDPDTFAAKMKGFQLL